MISVNNRFILEPYVKEGLKAKVTGGIATPGQRDGLKKLKVLVNGFLPNWQVVPAGSDAYIREDVLYNHPWASKVFNLTINGVEKQCIIVSFEHIELFDIMSNLGDLIRPLTIKND